MKPFSFSVIGLPAPKGSKSAFVVPGKGKKGDPDYKAPRAVVTDKPAHGTSDRLGEWKIAVSAAMQAALIERKDAEGWEPLDGALVCSVTFYLPRPASTPLSVRFPTKKPDADKLTRAVWDICSRNVWADDARITTALISKRFAIGSPGMTLTVWPEPMEDDRLI